MFAKVRISHRIAYIILMSSVLYLTAATIREAYSVSQRSSSQAVEGGRIVH